MRTSAGWSRPPGRVLEVHSPADWVGLVERHPMPVRWSCRGAWWESTGLDADWRIPDYASVARDWDGVHVSPIGYLTTVGRPLAAGAGCTVLAGWNPDETYWLVDTEVDPVPERWERAEHDDAHGWRRTGPVMRVGGRRVLASFRLVRA